MNSVALIACTNGYGHIRRLLLIAEALKKIGIESTLFAPKLIANYLADLFQIESPTIIDFDTETTATDWLNGNAWKWVQRIQDLGDYDEVVSDNLVDVLTLRKDAWLSGSFLWHESLSGIPPQIIHNQMRLLAIHRPPMFSSRLFTSKKIKSLVKVFEVGLFGKRYNQQDREKKNALIAIGKGSPLGRNLHLLIEEISKIKFIPFNKVWVDPEIFPTSAPKWMKPATFERHMYEDLQVAIIRPGVGTATESILAGAKIFAFYEEENMEMKENASTLEKMGLGKDCEHFSIAWEMAQNFTLDLKVQKIYKKFVYRLKPSGADDVVSSIYKKIKIKKENIK
jgi:hypothetical protein